MTADLALDFEEEKRVKRVAKTYAIQVLHETLNKRQGTTYHNLMLRF